MTRAINEMKSITRHSQGIIDSAFLLRESLEKRLCIGSSQEMSGGDFTVGLVVKTPHFKSGGGG